MTNHADLIAALRIPINVTLPGAPELDEYDEQRRAAADALEAVWAEATAAAYGRARNVAGVWGGTAVANLIHSEIASLTPQSARDWLAAHDAEVYRRGQEDMRKRAAEVLRDKWASTTAEHEEAISALQIKEKDDE